MSPEVTDNETPDQIWLIDETGGGPNLTSTSNGSTMNSSTFLLKLDHSDSEKEAMKDNLYYPPGHMLLIQQKYMDMKVMKDKKRSRTAKCCLLLAILVILTLCVITVVAATQIFCGHQDNKTNSVTIMSNNTGIVDTTNAYKVSSDLLMYILNNGRSNTTTTINGK